MTISVLLRIRLSNQTCLWFICEQLWISDIWKIKKKSLFLLTLGQNYVKQWNKNVEVIFAVKNIFSRGFSVQLNPVYIVYLRTQMTILVFMRMNEHSFARCTAILSSVQETKYNILTYNNLSPKTPTVILKGCTTPVFRICLLFIWSGTIRSWRKMDPNEPNLILLSDDAL